MTKSLAPRWEPGDGPTGTVAGARTRLEELRAMRDVMARHIDSPETLARDLAALVRQLRDVSREIEELEAAAVVAVEVGAGDEKDEKFRLEAI